jgi:hypothetical protein
MTFTPRPDDSTFVRTNSGFKGAGDEIAALEHGIALNLIAYRFPPSH